jgi:hypothetical protein
MYTAHSPGAEAAAALAERRTAAASNRQWPKTQRGSTGDHPGTETPIKLLLENSIDEIAGWQLNWRNCKRVTVAEITNMPVDFSMVNDENAPPALNHQNAGQMVSFLKRDSQRNPNRSLPRYFDNSVGVTADGIHAVEPLQHHSVPLEQRFGETHVLPPFSTEAHAEKKTGNSTHALPSFSQQSICEFARSVKKSNQNTAPIKTIRVQDRIPSIVVHALLACMAARAIRCRRVHPMLQPLVHAVVRAPEHRVGRSVNGQASMLLNDS